MPALLLPGSPWRLCAPRGGGSAVFRDAIAGSCQRYRLGDRAQPSLPGLELRQRGHSCESVSLARPDNAGQGPGCRTLVGALPEPVEASKQP